MFYILAPEILVSSFLGTNEGCGYRGMEIMPCLSDITALLRREQETGGCVDSPRVYTVAVGHPGVLRIVGWGKQVALLTLRGYPWWCVGSS